MVNGLALRRAATAAQAQAASTNNPTPVHSEDLQPNETLNRRRGAGLPPVVSAVGHGRIGLQMARRGGRGWHGPRGSTGQGRGNGATGEYRDVQRSRQPHDEASTPFQGRRPRPIPLPPPSSRQRAAQISGASSQPPAGDAASVSPNEERAKPFSMPLPALKPKVPLSGLPTTLVPRPASQAVGAENQFREYTPPPKRRRIDLTPEFVSPVSSNITRGSVITNASPLCARPVALPLSPSSIGCAEQKTSDDHASSPALPSLPLPSIAMQAPATPPIQMKREPESPPLLGEQRRAVSSQYQFYPFPGNCDRTNPEWEANRIAFRSEKERELKGRDLEIIGKCITRGDGISIQWKSHVLVWSDTLEPVSPKSKGNPNGNISTDFPRTSSATPRDADGPHRSPRDTIPHSPAPTRSTPAVNSTPQRPPRAPTSVSSSGTRPPSTPIPSSPDRKPPASPKRKRQNVPRASLDLATAILLSQRENASPRTPTPRRRLTTSSSSLRSTSSPATKRSKLPALPSTPSKLSRAHTPSRRPPFVQQEQAAATHADDDKEDEVGGGAPVARRKSVLRESSGWTVIQDIFAEHDSSDRIEEEVEEEQDQLVEDEVYELRDEMEVASIGTPRDESDEERDLVESVAMLSGDVRPSPVVDVVPLPNKMEEQKDADLDHLSRGFLTRYMQLYETDRAALISAYAPDAKFIYRVLEDSPHASPNPTVPQPKGSFFPLRTARGRAEISASLLGLVRTRFSQKVDDQGNKKVDVEFWSEQTGKEIWLYVRSIMAVEDTQEPSLGKKWTVDHSFLLRKRVDKDAEEGEEAAGKDDWPVVAHVHQLVMHERPL